MSTRHTSTKRAPIRLAAISLVPLIHVAWASSVVEDAEKEAILNAAKEQGIDKESHAHQLLDVWLGGDAPDIGEPPHLYDCWVDYVGALKATMSEDQYDCLRAEIVDFATEVAKAAGGFLGIGSISKAERQALSQIAAAFD